MNGDYYNKFANTNNKITNLGVIALTDVTPNISTGTFQVGSPTNLNFAVNEPGSTYYRSAPSYKNTFNASNYETIYFTATSDGTANSYKTTV